MKLVFDLTLLGLFHKFKICYEYFKKIFFLLLEVQGGFRTPETSKIEPFVTKVNGWNPFTTVIINFILEFAGVLDPPWNEALNILRKQPSRSVHAAVSKIVYFNTQFIEDDLGLLHDLSKSCFPADTKTSQKRLNFGLKDALYWSEMEIATTFF